MSLAVLPKIADLLADPAKAANLPLEAIPDLRADLARLDTLLLSRLIARGAGPAAVAADGDRLLSVTEAASKLGISKDYLYRNFSTLPFAVRIGRQVRFSEAGIDRYIRQRAGR